MSWISRLTNAFSSRKLDEEIAEELQGHIEALAASLKAEGLSETEASREARVRFGNVTHVKERTRDSKITGFAESVIQDLRYTLRSAGKSPGFYLTATLSLGLAIGAVTAIYSILAAAVLTPLPVRNPSQLVTLLNWSPDSGKDAWQEASTFNYPLYQDMKNAAAPSADLALFSPARGSELQGVTSRSKSTVMRQYISGGGFEVLGVTPALGRLLQPADDQLPNGNDVAVVSFDFWTRKYNRDPQVLGKRLQFTGHAYQIVGVARKGFFGVEPGSFVDIWVPAATYDAKVSFTSRHYFWFFVMGRLLDGTPEQLAAKMQPAFLRGQLEALRDAPPDLPARFKEMIKSARIVARPGEMGVSMLRRQFQQPVWVVFAVSVSLMLIACANIASLLLARGTARNAEMTMRASLGASQTRLLRQMLTESLLLSLAAGAGGWLLARMLSPVLVALLSTQENPVQFALFLDTKALLFTTLASTLAAILFGLLPAMQSSRAAPMMSLRSSSGQAGKLKLGRWMVSAQVAGAFCLVAVGAAFSFTLWHLISRDKGFESSGITAFEIGDERFDNEKKGKEESAFQLQARVSAISGIEGASEARWPIYQHSSWTEAILLPGKQRPDRDEIFYPVTPGYFNSMRTRLLSGRDLNDHDRPSQQPVATVVNASLAKRYFQTVDVVGKSFLRRGDKQELISHQIVGVVADAFYNGNREGAEAIVYLPLERGGMSGFTLYVRSPLPVPSVTRIVDEQAAALGTHVRRVTTLDTLVGNSMLREKLLAGLGTVFGFLSLLLAGIGVFGLLNYSVVRRTRELGIRAALGATRPNLVGLVARDLTAMMAVGVIAGLLAALSLMPLLRALFFGIETFDPSVMATAALLFLLATFIAGGLPARRAASIDPNVALRDE